MDEALTGPPHVIEETAARSKLEATAAAITTARCTSRPENVVHGCSADNVELMESGDVRRK